MKHFWIARIAAVAAVLSLSACADLRRDFHSYFSKLPSAGDFSETTVYVSGEQADAILSDRDKLRGVLSKFEGRDPDKDDSSLRTVIERLQEATGDRAPDALSGLGGVFARALVNAAERTLGEDGRFDGRIKVTIELSGKIRHYYFNDYTKGGYLEVDTKEETFVNGAVVQADEYLWAIAVLPPTKNRSGYVVHTYSGDPDDPFPGTVGFPPGALGADGSIQMRGLDHKLYVKGEGIVVLAVFKNGTLLPPSHEFYRRDSENCIDLMFKGYPPESELPRQSSYCLGRCDNPAVVNTK